jgi:hypothetical protein
MLLLDQSQSIDGYLQLKYSFRIPKHIAAFCETRFDSFVFRTDPFKPLTYSRIEDIALLVADMYNMPISLNKVEFYSNILNMFSWNLEIAKYSLMSVLHDNPEFPQFLLPDNTKEIVESYMIQYPEFIESITIIQNAFRQLIDGIDYEFIKKNPVYNPSTSTHHESDVEKFKDLGTLLWVYHYVWGVLDTTEFEDRMKDIGDAESGDLFDDIVLLRRGKKIALFNYNKDKTWTFYDVEYRNCREKKKNTDYPYTNIDEMTFFDIQGNAFIMHDDLVPSVVFYDDKGTRHIENNLIAGKTYFIDVSYPVKDVSKIQGKTVTFKPTLGCVFKDNELIIGGGGKVTTQISINSNLYKFKVANKEKHLPFKFFYNTKKINADALPWL